MHRLKLINIALAVAAFPMMALLARDIILLKYQALASPPAASAPAAPAGPPAIEEYSAIVENGVFPSASRRLERIDLLDAQAAASSSPALSELKLLGAYAGRLGMAVFEKAGSGQEVFRVGERVFGAGTLAEVGQDTAILTTGATDVTFRIFREELPEGLRSAPAPEARPGQAYTRRVSENEWVIDQRAVEAALSDMSRVLTDARLTPRLSGGAVTGFTVTEVKPRGIFDAIGITNGDVLTRINGFDIDSPEKAVQALSALRGQSSIELDIIRQGRPKSLRYSIR